MKNNTSRQSNDHLGGFHAQAGGGHRAGRAGPVISEVVSGSGQWEWSVGGQQPSWGPPGSHLFSWPAGQCQPWPSDSFRPHTKLPSFQAWSTIGIASPPRNKNKRNRRGKKDTASAEIPRLPVYAWADHEVLFSQLRPILKRSCGLETRRGTLPMEHLQKKGPSSTQAHRKLRLSRPRALAGPGLVARAPDRPRPLHLA